MKLPSILASMRTLPTVAVLALLGLPLHSAVVTWDHSDATNTWSTPANWDTDLEPTSADDVVLAAGLAATLTLSAGENAKTLQFDDDYTLTGGGLTLASASTMGVLLGQTATISTPLTVTGGTMKTGDGTLTLAAANTFTGGFAVNAGTLRISHISALGETAASGVTLAGGTLSARLNTGTTFTGPVNLTLTASSSILSDRTSFGAGFTYTFGPVAMGAHTLTVAPGTNPNSGTAGIVVGHVTLSGNPTFAVNDAGTLNGKLTTGSLIAGGVARTITKTGGGDLAITGGATDLIAGSQAGVTGGGNLELLFPALSIGSTSSITVTAAENPLGLADLTMSDGALRLLADGGVTGFAQTFVLNRGFTLAGSITLDPDHRTASFASKTFQLPSLTLGAGAVLSMAGDNTYGVRVAGAVALQGNVTLQGASVSGRDGLLTLAGGISDGGAGFSVGIAGGNSPLNLTLPAASTFSGGTTVSGSNVTLNAAGALGSGPLAQSGGSLVVNADGAIGGAITLSGGTLRVNDIDALAGNTVALDGGTLDLRSNTAATFTTGTLTVGGDATLNFANNGTGSAQAVTFGNAINVSGHRTLTVTSGSSFAPKLASIALAGDLTLASAIAVRVQSIGQDATPRRFLKTGAGTLQLDGPGTFTGGAEVLAGMLLLNDPGALGGSTLTLGDSSGAAATTVRLGVGTSLGNDIVIRGGSSGAATLSTTTAGLTWGGDIALQRTAILEASSGTTTFAGVLSGVGNLSKTGAGEIILGDAANTFGEGSAASVSVTAGTLTVATDGALGASANGVTIAGGTTFRANGTFTTARTITPAGVDPHIEVTAGHVLTLDAGLGGNVGFDKEGAGTLAFGPGVVSMRMATTNLRAGTLRLTGGTSLGAGFPIIMTGATLDLRNDTGTIYLHPLTISSGTNLVNVDRAIGGTATGGTHRLGPVALGAQTLQITGANGFGLELGATATTGTATLDHDAPGPLTVASIDLGGPTGTSTFTLDGDGGDVGITGEFAESGAAIYDFVKRGSHTLRLGTAFATRGTVTVTGGTLDLNGLDIVLASTLTVGGGPAPTLAGIATGASGRLVLGGDLRLVNDADVSFPGERRVLITGTGSIGTPASDGTLDLGGVVRTVAVTSNVVGANAANAGALIETPIVNGGIRKTGPRTLYLTGSGSTFAGGLEIAEGAVNVTSDAALGDFTNVVRIEGGATLQAGGDFTSARSFVLSAQGTAIIDTAGHDVTLGAASEVSGDHLEKRGAGTLTLAGGQDYLALTTSGGTTNVNSPLGSGSAIVNANATTNFGVSQTLAALHIGDGATVTLVASAGPAPAFAVPVPEPGSAALLFGGATALLGLRRRSRQ